MADMLITFIDLFLHLDRHLGDILQYFGVWTYVLLFLIIFCETGLVVTPILPGDSLLFGLGAFAANPYPQGAARGGMALHHPFDRGHRRGYGELLDRPLHRPQGLSRREIPLPEEGVSGRTHQFYEKHGGKTIVIARFIPIIRTFAPFVAGIGAMTYPRFIAYNVIGGIAWIGIFIFGGYFFGNLPIIKNNFTLVIIAIVILSVMPGVFEYLRQRRATT